MTAADIPMPPANPRTRDLTEAMVLRLFRNDPGRHRSVGHELIDAGWPWKIVCARLERMCDKDLLEYGTAITTPWLTPEGRAALKALA